MRFDYEILLNDFLWLRDVILDLPAEKFPFRTPMEIHEEKTSIVRELRQDSSFKLLTRLEADIRDDFIGRVRRKRRDALSQGYVHLARVWHGHGSSAYSQRLETVARRVPLEDILTRLRDHFRETGDSFHQDCSDLKGHFRVFRNWYAHGRPLGTLPACPDPESLARIGLEFERRVFTA